MSHTAAPPTSRAIPVSSAVLRTPDHLPRSRASTTVISREPIFTGNAATAPASATQHSLTATPQMQSRAARIRALMIHSSSSNTSTPSSSARDARGVASASITGEHSQVPSPPISARSGSFVDAHASLPTSQAAVVVADPAELEALHRGLIEERVKADGQLLSQWAQITDLAQEVLEGAAVALPDEHLRALVSQREELVGLTPQIMASIHETMTLSAEQDRSPSIGRQLSMSSVGSGAGGEGGGQSVPRSPSELLRSSSRGSAALLASSVTGTPRHDRERSSAGGSISGSKACRSLGLVDAFRDDAQLLGSHYAESIDARLRRRTAELDALRKQNETLSSHVSRLQSIRARRLAQDDQRRASFAFATEQLRGFLASVEYFYGEHLAREVTADELVPPHGGLYELVEDNSCINFYPTILSHVAKQLDAETREHHALVEFIREEPSEVRCDRWKHALASTLYPEAYVEDLEMEIQRVSEKRLMYHASMAPLLSFIDKVAVEENKNKLRKTDRSVSPAGGRTNSVGAPPGIGDVDTGRAGSTCRSPETVGEALKAMRATGATPRSLSPCSPRTYNTLHMHDLLAGAATAPGGNPFLARRSPRRSLDEVADDGPPETGRTTTATSVIAGARSFILSKSPTRRESVFRSNGMVHVPTSEVALELLMVPRQATCTTTRTASGEVLPSLRTLLNRRDRLKKELFRVQSLAKREMFAQLQLLSEAKADLDRRQAESKRRREAPRKQAA